MDSSWTKNGKQTPEKVAWFYQPNYTKLAAALLLKERNQRQGQLSYSNLPSSATIVSDKDIDTDRIGDKDVTDVSSDSDTGSCSSGKESVSDGHGINNGPASPTTTATTATPTTPAQSGHTPYYPSSANSSSTCDGDGERSKSRRSQPISRSNSSDSQTATSFTDLSIHRSEVERELEIVKEREVRSDTQMSDLEVAEELLSLVHVSTSLSYAPVKTESPLKQPENENDKERECSSDDRHMRTMISSSQSIKTNANDTNVNGVPASNATNGINSNSISASRGTGPYRRRTNACLEHKRKHQKCPYDCIFKKGDHSTTSSSSSRSRSRSTSPLLLSSASSASPSLSNDTLSKIAVAFQPDVSSISQLHSVLQATSQLCSVPKTPVKEKEKEFSSLVTTFFTFGMNVPSMNTLGTANIPLSPIPSTTFVNQTVIHL